MGNKYIIELDDNMLAYATITIDGVPYIKPLQLLPYTEPDIEQVREEAYEDGYKTAKVQCNIQAEKDMREVGERHYQHGLNDAWEAAKKLWDLKGDIIKVFRKYSVFDILDCYTASEVIEKIRQHEQEKEEQKRIQVGDEVDAPFGKAIVVNIDSVAKKIWVMYADGRSGFDFFKNAPTKTGRHFPKIAEVFAKMKETDNG